ncbi:hypothetical protein [Sulfuriferula nivalis]|uniref:Transmembrane protein n=1 Tax=Sulfuriferula nivalis TaxID=2675298 RepID=A0A809RM22_9PROT|nr:hypothetical protein [Sulfuriferula nivalis]BBO99840.1 hypothetical protein SFSGTM_05490 [Sulfuriferula nivalis]
MGENILFAGFSVWIAFTFSYQIRFLNLLSRLRQEKLKNNPSDRVWLYAIGLLLILIVLVNFLGVLGYAAIVGGNELMRTSYYGAFGLIGGVGLFLLCNWLVSEIKS